MGLTLVCRCGATFASLDTFYDHAAPCHARRAQRQAQADRAARRATARVLTAAEHERRRRAGIKSWETRTRARRGAVPGPDGGMAPLRISVAQGPPEGQKRAP